jgi:hypothetical protein
MKISKFQLQKLIDGFNSIDENKLKEHINNVKNENNYKNFEERILFDIFFELVRIAKIQYNDFRNLKDDHLYTGLKKAEKETKLFKKCFCNYQFFFPKLPKIYLTSTKNFQFFTTKKKKKKKKILIYFFFFE